MASSLAFGESAAVIAAYGVSGFTIRGEQYPTSVCVTASQVVPWNGDLSAPALLGFLASCDACGEILLIGTGNFHLPLLPTFRREIKQRFGLVVETMDTGAACRTFNILQSEGRQVIALLATVS
jgi:uncharacterized protein